MYRFVKEDYENRMDFDTNIDQLHEKGLLKNAKHPFFLFRDNRTPIMFPYSYPTLKSNCIKLVIDSQYNYYAMYSMYLPRNNPLTILRAHPELEAYFNRWKNPYNEFTPLSFNKFVSEDKKLDWFIYDDEGINFLIEMKKLQIDVKAKYKIIRNRIYFEDKIKMDPKRIQIPKLFFVKASFKLKKEDEFTQKIRVDSKTTALNIIENISKKVQQKVNDLIFDPKSKILKVKSLNDYIFDINDTMSQYSYIFECIKENKDPEYCVINNPLLDESPTPSITEEFETSISSGYYVEKSLQMENLLNIASYNPSLDEKDDRINPMEYLNITTPQQTKSRKKNPLSKLMNDIEHSLNIECKKNYESLIKTPQNNKENEKLNMKLNTVDEEDIKVLEDQFWSNTYDSIKIEMNERTFTSQRGGRRKRMIPREPNYFKEEEKKKLNIQKMHEDRKAYINITDINLPFSIFLHSVNLKNVYNSKEFDKTSINTVLLFRLQLLSGNIPFSKPKQIKWRTNTGDLNPLFNKRIYFELNYCDIPNFITLQIRVKFIRYKSKMEVSSNNTVLWLNFRLFDHNKRLKTGRHKLNFWDRPFGDDSFYWSTDNDDDSNTICFEVDSFALPVINKVTHLKNFSPPSNSNFVFISQIDMGKLDDIACKNPFDELTNIEKDILYKNRLYIAQMSQILPKLFMCFNLGDPRHLIELEKVLESTKKKLKPVQAIELLNGRFLHESIRAFAVRCLKSASYTDLQDYLLQLVQGLKYEMTHNSPLAIYLLTIAINHPFTIGHSLFWSLRSEMYNPNVQQRFGLYLEVFLNKIGRELCKIYQDEDFLVKKLVDISKIPKDTKRSKQEVQVAFVEALQKLDGDIKTKKMEISIPLNFKFRIVSIDVNNCKVMKSKKKPLWLTFKNADDMGEDIVVMFKAGDDLRMDMVTLQLFKAMLTMWYENKLKVKMSIYSVMCTGFNQGMLEMVKNSVTLAQIHKKEGGAFQSFFSNSLKKWLENNINLSPEEYIENFLISCVAYCAATFVLGIGDRHNDNIMLKTNGELFHIDFGHFLGHFKYKMGIKRERAPFVFTEQFQNVLGGEKGDKFNEFKKKFWEAFKVLRNNADLLISLLRILLCTGIPELDEKSIKYLDMSLALGRTKEEEAKKFLEEKLNESVKSMSTKVMFAIHIVANK